MKIELTFDDFEKSVITFLTECQQSLRMTPSTEINRQLLSALKEIDRQKAMLKTEAQGHHEAMHWLSVANQKIEALRLAYITACTPDGVHNYPSDQDLENCLNKLRELGL